MRTSYRLEMLCPHVEGQEPCWAVVRQFDNDEDEQTAYYWLGWWKEKCPQYVFQLIKILEIAVERLSQTKEG